MYCALYFEKIAAFSTQVSQMDLNITAAEYFNIGKSLIQAVQTTDVDRYFSI